MAFEVRPEWIQERIQDSLDALRSGNPNHAKVHAMLAGVNCANLGEHDCPEAFIQRQELADQWQWGHDIGNKGFKKKESPKQKEPMWWQKD